MKRIIFFVVLPLVFLVVLFYGGFLYTTRFAHLPAEPVICSQVMTPARDPSTGVVKEFSTPCDVPSGWDTLENGGNDVFVSNGNTYKHYTNFDFGINFAYRIEPDGYLLALPKVNSMDVALEKVLTLMTIKDSNELASSTTARDGPRAISIMIFKNPENVHADVWLKAHTEITNYLPTHQLDKVNLGGTKGAAFSYDGLYQNESVVLENNYKVYVFTVSYDSKTDQIYKDWQDFLRTISLF